MRMVKKPNIPLSQLKTKNEEAYEVFQIILRGLIDLHWHDLKSLNLGYEAKLESFEELIENGLLGIVMTDNGYYLEYYNYILGEYTRVGQ